MHESWPFRNAVFERISSRRNFLLKQKYFFSVRKRAYGRTPPPAAIFRAPAVEILAQNWNDERRKTDRRLKVDQF